MTMITHLPANQDRLVLVADVARTLGVVADDIERGAWDVTVHQDWSGRPAITEDDAARIRTDLLAREEAERQRTREDNAERAREQQAYNDDRERRFWSAFASVVEHSNPKDPRVYINATATAHAVIHDPDPEDALRRVIRLHGEPSEAAIMYVMGRSKNTSATGKAKGRPSWL